MTTSVLEDILEWSKGRPDWQRDALRRLVEKGNLDDEDVEELTLILKSRHGLTEPGMEIPKTRPLSEIDIPAREESSASVSLLGIRDVRHVNALSGNQILPFEPCGITVVYGDNASGKSGYARIVKRICRARSRGNPILPNVFKKPQGEPAQATIEYKVGESSYSLEWRDGDPGPPELTRISFFDEDCASVHIGEANELAFTPFGLDLLAKQAQACHSMKDAMEWERKEIERQKPTTLTQPQARQETTAGQRLANMTDASSLAEFQQLATLSEGEQIRLQNLQATVAQDPAKLAAQVSNRMTRLDILKRVVNRASRFLTKRRVIYFSKIVIDARAKAEAATLAATKLFGDERLPNIGRESWRALWEAARHYSEIDAYPDRKFPVTDAEAVCVLCQQPLNAEASNRLLRFESFVQEATQRAAEKANKRYDRMFKKLQRPSFPPENSEENLKELSLEDQGLCDEVRKFLDCAEARRQAILEACETNSWDNIPTLPEPPSAKMDEVVKRLSKQKKDYDDATSSNRRKELVQELGELEDRQWLSQVMPDVEREIARLRTLKGLEACISETDTHALTRKSSELTDRYVTQALGNRFVDELSRLGLNYVRLRLTSEGQYGAKRYRISFADACEDVKVPQVLSDGERGCVAMAAFLTELATSRSKSALVFDDPVSSLDDQWRRKVATRLVEEARRRQVVVFTHDIVFLRDLKDFSEKDDVTFDLKCLKRNSEETGVCSAVPWDTMNTGQRIGFLRNQLQEAGAVFRKAKDGRARYEALAQYLYGLLREAWERAVEEILLNGVVVRFSREIQTKRLKSLKDITATDVESIDNGMTKCSRFLPGHDKAPAANEPVPEPDELAQDIQDLDDWIDSVRRRRGKKQI